MLWEPCWMKNLHLFKNLIDIMPTLSQVQTYIKNRISAIGNNNNINELKQFLESIRYDPEKTADDLFPFGVQLGNGSDEEHFHLGFTGAKLSERLITFKNSGLYHIDANYKIVNTATHWLSSDLLTLSAIFFRLHLCSLLMKRQKTIFIFLKH